jgi:hypothetical protein
VKPVVAIAATPPRHDPRGRYGLQAARNYAAAFARLGFEPVIVELSDSDPAPLGQLLEPRVALLFSHGGWLLDPAGPLGPDIGATLRRANKPTIVVIGDPVFSPWLPPIFANLPPRAVPFFIDPSFADGIAHWIPSQRSAPTMPAAHLLDGHGPVPTAEKTIPLLFVGATFNANRFHAEVKTKHPTLWSAFAALVEANLADMDRPLTRVAAETLPALGEAFDMDNPRIRDVLYLADMYLRNRQRNLVLDRVVRYPGVIVSPGLAGLPPGSKATLMPGQPFLKILELLRLARATVVCQPHYPGALNERIVHAMQARCAVIAMPNPRIRQTFLHRQHLLLTSADLSDLDALIADASRLGVAEPMREGASRRIAERYTPDHIIRYMLASMAEGGLLGEIDVPPGPRLSVPPLPAPRAARHSPGA